MKNSFMIGLAMVATLYAGQADAEDKADNKTEVLISRLFIVENGFDDNDTVEVTLEGYKENACFILEDEVVLDRSKIDENKYQVKITQYAKRSYESLYCSNVTEGLTQKQLQDRLVVLSTKQFFTKVIKLGKWPSGKHEVLVNVSRDAEIKKSFNVETSPVKDIDSALYANVNQVSIPEEILFGTDAIIELSGILNNSCYKLNSIRQELQNDTWLIRPLITLSEGPCLMVTTPFWRDVNSKDLNLGHLPLGRYLVHVRTPDSNSINRAFSVVERLTPIDRLHK